MKTNNSMNLPEVIEQLKSLIADRESFVYADGEARDIYLADKAALEAAVRLLACIRDFKGIEIDSVKPSASSSLETLCGEAVAKWGMRAQIGKAIEELQELSLALSRYQNTDPYKDFDYTEGLIDNIQEEREDAEIMLLQLDAIFDRSEEWQRKKHEHLRQIVEGEA